MVAQALSWVFLGAITAVAYNRSVSSNSRHRRVRPTVVFGEKLFYSVFFLLPTAGTTCSFTQTSWR